MIGIVASPVKRRLRLVPGKPEPEKEREKISDTLILSDFDQTLTDCDAGTLLLCLSYALPPIAFNPVVH